MDSRISENSLVYIAQFDPDLDVGVYKKISGVVRAAQNKGINSKLEVVNECGWKGVPLLYKLLISSDDNIIILRNCGIFMLFLFPALLWVRLRGRQQLIIDVPTPIAVFLKESRARERALYKKLIFESLIWLSFPLALWPAHRVIQYGRESTFFSFGVKKVTREIGNGVDITSVPLREFVGNESSFFSFIGVANVADWHGYDRLIRGLAELRNSSPDSGVRAKFIVVGNGGQIDALKALSINLGVADCVEFVGRKTGKDLSDFYSRADIAIASLALHRKGIVSASELKAREYTAVGIPFLMSAFDSDFVGFDRYIYRIESSDAPIDVLAIINWYRKLNFRNSDAVLMRKYAATHLDFSAKIEEMIF